MTPTIIIGTSVLILEALPNVMEAAIKIQKLLREQGIEANIQAVNRQAIEASTETERIIAEWKARQTQGE